MDPALGLSMIFLRRKRWLKILNVLCIQFSLVDAPYALSIFWECKFWRMTKTKIITKVLKILPKKTRISKIKAIQFFSKFYGSKHTALLCPLIHVVVWWEGLVSDFALVLNNIFYPEQGSAASLRCSWMMLIRRVLVHGRV